MRVSILSVIAAAISQLLGSNQPPTQPSNPPPAYLSEGAQQVVIQLPSLKFFCDGRHEALLRYLEGSPHWRVGVETTEVGTTTVAYQREGMRISLNGYRKRGKSDVRVGFVFAEAPNTPPFMAPCVTQAAPDAGETAVATASPRILRQQRVAHLFVGTPGLWLSIVVRDQEGALAEVPALLDAVEVELAAIRAVLEGGGAVLDAMKPDATRRGNPSLQIDENDQQTLHVNAWINPGEAGVTEVRAKSAEKGKPLTISFARLYSRERVGFSAEAGKLFYANSGCTLEETATGWNTSHDVIFELWFIPDSGGPERMLIEQRTVIKGYEH